MITAAQTAISFMTVSPSLDRQFTVLLDLSVMTNLIPYLLSMSALMVLQHVEHVSDKLARKANNLLPLCPAHDRHDSDDVGWHHHLCRLGHLWAHR